MLSIKTFITTKREKCDNFDDNEKEIFTEIGQEKKKRKADNLDDNEKEHFKKEDNKRKNKS